MGRASQFICSNFRSKLSLGIGLKPSQKGNHSESLELGAFRGKVKAVPRQH